MIKKYLLSALLPVMITFAGHAQKSEILLDHYKNEYRTFKEFIKNSEAVQGDTNIDVKFYYIDIAIGIYSPYISGDVTIVFEPLAENLSELQISLNSALTVESVSSPAASFYQDNDVIMITLDSGYGPGELVELTISYAGIPVEAGGYKGLRYETHATGEPVIATLSTPYLAHYWYPCKDGPEDKPDSVYMDITIPDEEISGIPLVGVSNGVLENIIDNGDTRTFQWRHRYPVVTYYVMAAISNYVFFGEDYSGPLGESFPLEYYVFQENLVSAQAGVSGLPDAIDFYSEVFGTYPFSNEKYGMTQLGFYGAIENQTNTIQNNLSTSWFYTSIHELAHMWFGDMITLANWHHGWLNEGFATYAEALWDEHTYGFDKYKENMAGNEFWSGGTLYLENAADTFNTFQAIYYSKGAYAVHMLRGVLGDDVFFDALLDYTQNPNFMYRNASTEDLQESFENTSGLALDFFFEQWVYDEYWPYYYYNYAQNSNNELYFVIHQAQEELYGYRPVFEMPVQVKINYSNGGDTTVTVWNDQQTQTFYVPLGQEVESVQIDPDKWILRKVMYQPDLPVGISDYRVLPEILAYPNPFTHEVTLTLEHLNADEIQVSVYNLDGKKVRQLHKGQCLPGMSICWDGNTASGRRAEPGLYLIGINSGGAVFTKQVILK